MYGDGVVEFASGQITSIGPGATLNLQTGSGFVADQGAIGANSALVGLSSNYGTLTLSYGATITTSAGTNLSNTSYIGLDTYGPGASSLAIGGQLTNTGTLSIGNGSLGSATKLLATGLDNLGTINLAGNNTPNSTQAIIDIAGDAGFGETGALTGTVNLYGDALIEFAGGSLTRIAAGASLNLQTAAGFIADSDTAQSNSALVGLTSNAGTFSLAYGASVATRSDTDFLNTGTINVDFWRVRWQRTCPWRDFDQPRHYRYRQRWWQCGRSTFCPGTGEHRNHQSAG